MPVTLFRAPSMPRWPVPLPSRAALACLFIGGLAAMALSACSHVPVRSLLALSRLDFGTTDLRALRAALRLPEQFEARETRMVVEIAIEGRAPIQQEFVLERLLGADLAALASENRTGAQLVAYRLPDAAVRSFERLREEIGQARAASRKGSLAIKLEPEFCYRVAPPRETLVFTTYLSTSETQRYIPVLLDFDAFSQKAYAEKLRMMPKC